MAKFLLEIGTEELPPASIGSVLAQLASDARAALVAARLEVEDVVSTGTVRRLVLMADGVPDRQQDRVTQVRGPAARIAYNPAGEPTQAALGFARSQDVPVESLQVREVEGGRYVVAEIREAGRPAIEVLGHLLPGVIAGLSFPRTMRWADAFRFGRPIRWIVALLDQRILKFEIAGVKAGRRTAGHRFLAPGSLAVPDAGAYRSVIRRGRVVLDPQERRKRIVEGATVLAREVGGEPILDPALLDELVWSTEHPTPLLGGFDAAFASALPRPVVLVTLQHHQRYFGVQDAAGTLLPAFVAVRDGGTSHTASVRTGHEWVTRARLADGQFFLDEDRQGTFDQWNAALARVAHAAGLGTMADHVQRLRRIAAWLAHAVGMSGVDRRALERAAQLCKADLVTALVREFPELQGTVGSIYAREKGEAEAVALAIEEHYRPRGAGDAPPATLPGALLSTADRAVLLVGTALAGLEPSGSQDPYGLRRAAAGTVVALVSRDIRIGLRALFTEAAATFEQPRDTRDRAAAARVEFVLQRLRGWLLEQGMAYDTADAVLATGGDDVLDLVARARALHAVRSQPVMMRLATGFARASRILSQGRAASAVDEGLLAEQAEMHLYNELQAVRAEVEQGFLSARAGEVNTLGGLTRRHAFALQVLVRLADPIDRFFDDVLVMASDQAVRANRLALLRAVTASFLRVADFNKLVEERRG